MGVVRLLEGFVGWLGACGEAERTLDTLRPLPGPPRPIPGSSPGRRGGAPSLPSGRGLQAGHRWHRRLRDGAMPLKASGIPGGALDRYHPHKAECLMSAVVLGLGCRRGKRETGAHGEVSGSENRPICAIASSRPGSRTVDRLGHHAHDIRIVPGPVFAHANVAAGGGRAIVVERRTDKMRPHCALL